jgi:hypothetical protein
LLGEQNQVASSKNQSCFLRSKATLSSAPCPQ